MAVQTAALRQFRNRRRGGAGHNRLEYSWGYGDLQTLRNAHLGCELLRYQEPVLPTCFRIYKAKHEGG